MPIRDRNPIIEEDDESAVWGLDASIGTGREEMEEPQKISETPEEKFQKLQEVKKKEKKVSRKRTPFPVKHNVERPIKK
jgi:hypothetical protein